MFCIRVDYIPLLHGLRERNVFCIRVDNLHRFYLRLTDFQAQLGKGSLHNLQLNIFMNYKYFKYKKNSVENKKSVCKFSENV